MFERPFIVVTVRYRDRPLREGLDLIADRVRDWSGGSLRDDVSLLAVERTADAPLQSSLGGGPTVSRANAGGPSAAS